MAHLTTALHRAELNFSPLRAKGERGGEGEDESEIKIPIPSQAFAHIQRVEMEMGQRLSNGNEWRELIVSGTCARLINRFLLIAASRDARLSAVVYNSSLDSFRNVTRESFPRRRRHTSQHLLRSQECRDFNCLHDINKPTSDELILMRSSKASKERSSGADGDEMDASRFVKRSNHRWSRCGKNRLKANFSRWKLP
jgi:hypothetical protein